MPPVSASVIVPPKDAVYALDGGGEIWMWQPRPGLVVSVGEGHFALPIAEAIVRFLARASPKPVRAFHDWSRVAGYETAARVLVTEWMQQNRDAVSEYHVAIGSKLLAMGASVVSLATGIRIQTYPDRAAFVALLSHALA